MIDLGRGELTLLHRAVYPSALTFQITIAEAANLGLDLQMTTPPPRLEIGTFRLDPEP